LPSTPPTSRRTARPRAQKGGFHPGYRHLARRAHDQDPRTDRRSGATARASAFRQQHQRHDHGCLADRRHRAFTKLIADKGYDTNAIRAQVAARGAEAVIPSTASRHAPIPYDRDAYRARNLVEHLWCHRKDWRRIATRYDKLATNYLSAALIAAAIIYWCN
jgi:transposase